MKRGKRLENLELKREVSAPLKGEKVGALYPNMSVFRLAVRHYAIMKEFELGIETTSTSRYRGLCMGDDCPWRLHAVLEVPGSATIIVFNFFLYYLYLPFILLF